MQSFLKKVLPDVLIVLAFLLIGFLYFQTPLSEGMVLSGHDNDAAVGLGRDVTAFQEATGETSRWTNSIFSGMPTYQISPSYESTNKLSLLSHIYTLGMDGVLCYVFVYLLGFYILMRTLRLRPWLSALGAVAWAFSSYFFIIIAAGHIWKVMTLGFVPPTIAGLILCYRGRWLWGGAVTALFTALQILSNHIQMSYYFGFVMLCIVLAYGIAALVPSKSEPAPDAILPRISFRKWLVGTAIFVAGGMVGLLANVPNLYHTYDYAKSTMRGPAELTPTPTQGQQAAEKPASTGLDYDYITQWSYGVDETLTLLIPDFKGGGSQESMLTMPAVENNELAQTTLGGVNAAFGMGAMDYSPITSSYWGRQPMTVGPVYVGALVFFLFLLGLFIVRSPLKWGLLAATIISLLFAWGNDIPAVTHFLIDHLPLYNKFRTVSSALVMAEFTIPLLAMMALAEILRRRDLFATDVKARTGLFVSLGFTAGICLLFWLAPSLTGSCITNTNEELIEQTIAPYSQQLGVSVDEFRAAITSARHDILSASALRSLLIILVGAAMILLYTRFQAIRGWMLCLGLSIVCLGDMWAENKRYLNDSNFADPTEHEGQFVQQTPADQMILADTDPHYRVADLQGMTTNNASYYHKTIGGYHAAKLRRYNDLLERNIYPELSKFGAMVKYLSEQLSKDSTLANAADAPAAISQALAADSTSNFPVLNMLNTKYVICNQGAFAIRNPKANGNAWFVQSLQFVKDADGEIAALQQLDTKRAAVADERFRSTLEGSALGEGTAQLTQYAPNRLAYTVESDKGGLLVFSEIYYPGWQATVDGQPAELGRVNYVLRAMKVAAGKHEVVLEFRPTSVSTTNTVAYIAIALILILLIGAAVSEVRRQRTGKATGK